MSGDDFLSRWSRRKHEARRSEPVQPVVAPDVVSVPPAEANTPLEPAQPPAPLPAVESLTPESDFTPFMRDEVDPGLRRQALRTLFRDPRFNVMDGLDVYIDDFSKPDPIPPDWLGKLNQMAYLGDCAPAEESTEGKADAETVAEPDGKVMEEQPVVANEPERLADTSVHLSPPPELKESDI